MIYSAFLIPLIISIACFFIYSKKITWWEILLNIGATSVGILIVTVIMSSSFKNDEEYNGYFIKEARYYEYWETYVDQTCTSTVSCGENCTTTVTYDCSYCDTNSPVYSLVDTGNNEYYVSENEYKNYVRLWNHKSPEFVELNRRIDESGSCGEDGDMYRVTWNGDIKNSVASTKKIYYKNKLKANKSAFDYPTISSEKARSIGLYDYPKVDNYYQNSVLGSDSLNFKNKKYFNKRINYINGLYGNTHNSRVYILLFKNKPLDIAIKQEYYWEGGNRNELVICIGVDDKANITWVKPFSWTSNKTILPNVREDLMEIGTLNNSEQIAVSIEKNIEKYFKWRNFEVDFKYLTYSPSTGGMIFIYIFALILSVGIAIWCVSNDENPKYKI